MRTRQVSRHAIVTKNAAAITRVRAWSQFDRKSGAGRVRTDDPRLAKPMLSQLSYSPFELEPIVGPARLELATPRLSSVCSNQLSYGP